MTTPRVYLPPELCHLNPLDITGERFHYLVRVLRVRPGDEVEVLDGAGNRYGGRVEEINRDSLRLSLNSREWIEMELPRFHLFQALPQGKRMEEVIRRTVELGVYALHPFISSRSLSAREKKGLQRWEKLGMEASRTAGRAYLPIIYPILDWDEMLREISELDKVLLADERGGEKVGEALGDGNLLDVGLLVGPEGGFSLQEKEEILSVGAVPVYLGKYILRTESAGAVLLTLARHHFGFI